MPECLVLLFKCQFCVMEGEERGKGRKERGRERKEEEGEERGARTCFEVCQHAPPIRSEVHLLGPQLACAVQELGEVGGRDEVPRVLQLVHPGGSIGLRLHLQDRIREGLHLVEPHGHVQVSRPLAFLLQQRLVIGQRKRRRGKAKKRR